MRTAARRALLPLLLPLLALSTLAVSMLAGASQPAASQPGASQPGAFQPGASQSERSRQPVSLVLVPELTWASAPPALDGFAKANLTLRAAERRPRPADVYLTLGKGRRSGGLRGGGGAGAPAADQAELDPSRPRPGEGVGAVEPLAGGGLRLAEWPALVDNDRRLNQGGRLGAVGEALREGGRRWAVAGPDPAMAAVAATAAGTVPRAFPDAEEGARRVAAGDLDVLVAVVAPDALGPALRLLEDRCTVVASASTPGRSNHLGALATSPACGLGSGGLASPSTHQSHLATLPDVTRTFLRLAGLSRPAGVAGSVLVPVEGVPVAELVDRDDRVWTSDRARLGLTWLFVILHAVGAVTAVVWRRARVGIACTLLAIPPASFLMMAVPWWRAGALGAVLAGGTLSALIAVGGTLLARRDVGLAVMSLAWFTSAVIALDALFGSPLQIDAPFGNSPVVAGRFFGIGNIGSGLLVGGLLVAGGIALDRWGRSALPAVAASLVAGAVAGGAPQFGADLGGVLFGVPAYGVLLLGATVGRVRLRHLAAALVAAVAAVGLFVAVDLVRDVGSQTHLARSLGGDGVADDVARKAGRAAKTIGSPMANMVLVAAAALAFTGWSPRHRPALRAASWAVLTAAVLGSALNDSGLNVGAAVLAVAWPAAVAIGLGDEELSQGGLGRDRVDLSRAIG